MRGREESLLVSIYYDEGQITLQFIPNGNEDTGKVDTGRVYSYMPGGLTN